MIVRLQQWDGKPAKVDKSQKYRVIGENPHYPIGTIVCPITDCMDGYPGFHFSRGWITVCPLSIVENNGTAQFAGFELSNLELIGENNA